MALARAALLGTSLIAGVVAVTALVPLSGRFATAAAAETGAAGQVKVGARRLTESQYRHEIADIFGPELKLNARFEPERREDGLLAIGDAQLSITAGGFERYFALARSVSSQVLNVANRDAVVGCKPADFKRADDACATQFVRRYGEQLFRRPMTSAEVSARVAIARRAGENGDFYSGLNMALVSLLVAPEFLFRIEVAEPDPLNPGKLRLDGYTRAQRLSFLMWDAAPDAELNAAAKSGSLYTEAGLKQQAARMAESPRMRDGARAFFTDMLQLDAFESLSKDPAIYPKFSQAVADSAREQTLRTVLQQLVDDRGDYRDIFTRNDTVVDRVLASVYKVPFGFKDGWTRYTFPQESERSGILTQATFLSLFSHPGRSSPTKRGVKLYEIFMCSPTPDPPADVDFAKVRDSNKGTVRGRLTDHMTNPGCAQCHRVSDPAGLALEHFDSIGQLRTIENGQTIDVSSEINGVKLVGAQGLGRMMHDNPRVPACLVRNVYYYGVGRGVDERDASYLAAQTRAFVASGYQFPSLLAQIATSSGFYKVVVPSGAKPATPVTLASATPPPAPSTRQGAVR